MPVGSETRLGATLTAKSQDVIKSRGNRKSKPRERINATYVSPDNKDPKDPKKLHPSLEEKQGNTYVWASLKRAVTFGNHSEYNKMRKGNNQVVLGDGGPVVVCSPQVVQANQATHNQNFEFALNSFTAHRHHRTRAVAWGLIWAVTGSSLLANRPVPLHTVAQDIASPFPVLHSLPYFHKGHKSATPNPNSSTTKNFFSPDTSSSLAQANSTTPTTTATVASAPNLSASPDVFPFGIQAEITTFQFASGGKTYTAVCEAVAGLKRNPGEGLVDSGTTVNAIHRAESATGVVNSPTTLGANPDFQQGVFTGLFQPHKAPYDNPANYTDKAGAKLVVPIDCRQSPE